MLLFILQRVLNIDIYHGDGVEEAFYTIDRVMVVPFMDMMESSFPVHEKSMTLV